MQLENPLQKFDHEVVYEFYANVWGERQIAQERRARVRGRWVPFNPQSINTLVIHSNSMMKMMSAYTRC